MPAITMTPETVSDYIAKAGREAWKVPDVPANTPHGYTTIDHTHFLTIVSKGNAAKFFREVAKVEMNPPDIPGVIRVGEEHGITFLT